MPTRRSSRGGGAKVSSIDYFDFASARTDEAAQLMLSLPLQDPQEGVELLEEQLWLSTPSETFLAWSRPVGAPGGMLASVDGYRSGPFIVSVPLLFSPGFDATLRLIARTAGDQLVTYDLLLTESSLDALTYVASVPAVPPEKAPDDATKAYEGKMALFEKQVLESQTYLLSLPEEERAEVYGAMKAAALAGEEVAP